MKNVLTLLLSGLLLAACGQGAARGKRPAAAAVPAEPVRYTYAVRAVHPHLTTSYTQGLQFVDGTMWEGTGQHGESVLQRIDLATGKASIVARLPRTEFGEGITLLDGKIYQLTWQSNKAYVYDAASGRKLREFRYAGEGWGLTTDGRKLYLSDGSAAIHTIDPATFRREGHVTVTYRGEPVQYLNELEWIDGRIWANVYTTDQIAIIDPATGLVEGVVDLTGLLPEEDMTPATDVLNGIAYDAATGRIFVTGKNWPKLFEIEIIRQ
ncbi:glutaminyl-peptide cyclotransferase [Alistipes sp.]|uniref:glutaminyl-peptide cyclotransferase n=1 Tax=Alistipes sp. TaxID=1872444 RepID=UPI003AF13837